jgi:hypothetical protein
MRRVIDGKEINGGTSMHQACYILYEGCQAWQAQHHTGELWLGWTSDPDKTQKVSDSNFSPFVFMRQILFHTLARCCAEITQELDSPYANSPCKPTRLSGISSQRICQQRQPVSTCDWVCTHLRVSVAAEANRIEVENSCKSIQIGITS